MNEPQKQVDDGKETNHKRWGREMAMQFLYQYDLCDSELNEKELDLFWLRIEVTDPELIGRKYKKARKFADRLIRGVAQNIQEIDETIKRFSLKWDIKRMAVVDRNLIRVAVYEMLHCYDIPPVVSINEAIEISKDFGSEKSGTFINGILNGVKNSLDRPAREAVPQPS